MFHDAPAPFGEIGSGRVKVVGPVLGSPPASVEEYYGAGSAWSRGEAEIPELGWVRAVEVA